MAKQLKTWYWFAMIYTALGLASGLFYREFTKLNGVPGGTQLAVAHTHLLTLGTIFSLIFLVLERLFRLSEVTRRYKAFVITWNAGVLVTATMLVVKGCLQVLGSDFATSPMIAGISGLGHMTITAAFILLMIVLGKRLAESESTHA
ncbi:Protein of unknown function [Tessaracoccus bendigoensis DSM 12906]|uniref:DUF2871 domain-containing protein n=1 Tax=Tessaracoccus bendigoensis DSM 12906 TaxID=1123357 RepID=A0A1M6NUY4_9ACTN|nr:DUF2871 domain-containing protein [Tessaracoccus bendigoensis]SHJ99452.1 Protein of unknown function [Tessaracoccus bendigoensis DSM 12906]